VNLDAIASLVAENVKRAYREGAEQDLLEIVLSGEVVRRLLSLPEAPTRKVFNTRGGSGRTDVSPDLVEVLFAWLRGAELTEMASAYFSQAAEIGYRFEQLGDYINDYFEVFLPSAVATVIVWANEKLEADAAADPDILIPDKIASFIRWGTDEDVALGLLLGGLTSRRLARQAASEYVRLQPEGSAREWLGAMTIQEILERFAPSPPELRSLVDFARGSSLGLAARLLSSEEVEVTFQPNVDPFARQRVELLFAAGTDFPPISIILGRQVVGHVTTSAYSDLHGLSSSGFVFSAEAWIDVEGGHLSIRLVEPPQD
jgi:hypothetical protein